MNRGLVAASLAVVTLAVAPRARAEGGGQACARSYVEGQELRQQQKLVRARGELLACAQQSCPAFMQAECTRWLAEVDAALPTVVVDARDPSGAPVVVAKLWIDGAPREASGATAIPIDPGEHDLRVETKSGASATAHVLVREGEKSRVVAIPVAEPARAEPPPPSGPSEPSASSGPARSRGLPAGAYVAGGVAALGLAGFAVFGVAGVARQLDLRASCGPRCPDADVSSLRREYLVADVSLGVGVAASAVLAWIVLSRKAEHVAIGVEPTGRLVARGTF